MRSALLAVSLIAVSPLAHGQTSGPTFEVVSIKRHSGSDNGLGMRTEPDGTQRFTNVPMSLPLGRAFPVPMRDITGLPDWVNNTSERYDITAKPSEGAS